jgi:N-acetylglucosaminyldiphosphoundecaprenol N-acetyl-beta-D-mannosaminyltransferase
MTISRICGVDIHGVTMAEAVERIGRLVEGRTPSIVVTPNVDHVVRFQGDREFQRAYAEAALVLADGAPLLWAGRLLGAPLPERVAGSDLFPELCRAAAERGHRLFFLGGRPGAAEGAAEVMRRAHPGIAITGTSCPPFGFEHDPEENARIVEAVRSAAPDILFVGLGSPKQEKWILANRSLLGVPVSIGVGVTFEFVAGMVRRAPLWMQTAGLEWLWRLIMEPRRLWRRYLVEDTRFLWLVLGQKWGRNAARMARG